MASQPVDELPRDLTIMRTLVRETSHTAGIYASVVVEGEVAIGSPMELLDPESSGD